MDLQKTANSYMQSKQYGENKVKTAFDYVDNYKQYGDSIPTMASLALELNVSTFTLLNWGKKHPEFQLAIDRLKLRQEAALINGGLTRDYDSSLSKLLLRQHGYKDGAEIDVRSIGVSLEQSTEEAEKIKKALIKDILDED